MPNINNKENVVMQYENDKNLSMRMDLHKKHSTSTADTNDWLFAQYNLNAPYRILELGCGNGWQWEERIKDISSDSLLVLSDFSIGMVNSTWEQYKQYPNVLVQKIDIQEIPFPDESFDKIIANHMLYHVPDISKALSEIKRVLAQDGTFYCTTNGNAMRLYLDDKLKKCNSKFDAFSEKLSFNLQNGNQILSNYFNYVNLVEFIDSLKVTDTNDLVSWIRSNISAKEYSQNDFNEIYNFFEAIRVSEGAINIPKEKGMFISKNSKVF